MPVASADFEEDSPYVARCFDELERLADEKQLRLNGGIRVFTFLDQTLQHALTEICAPETAEKRCDVIAAATDISACGFTAYYSSCGNLARSPASLFKPLCAYAPAFEEGILSPATPIDDSPVSFDGYSPQNYGGGYSGYLSARECLARSLNVPAVKILNALTVQKSRGYLEKTGLRTDENDFSLAAALGGVGRGYTLTELLSAYSVFAQNGNYRPAGFIRRIEIDGKTVYDAARDNSGDEKARVFGGNGGADYRRTENVRPGRHGEKAALSPLRRCRKDGHERRQKREISTRMRLAIRRKFPPPCGWATRTERELRRRAAVCLATNCTVF